MKWNQERSERSGQWGKSKPRKGRVFCPGSQMKKIFKEEIIYFQLKENEDSTHHWLECCGPHWEPWWEYFGWNVSDKGKLGWSEW